MQVGSARVELREMASQEVMSLNKPLSVLDVKTGKTSTIPGTMLYFKARFQYSKVVPLRKKIYQLADQKRMIEKQITMLRVPRPKK
jgi:hypothetical protein